MVDLSNAKKKKNLITSGNPLEKSTPANVDAENCIIGGILLDNRLAAQVFGGERRAAPDDFFSPINVKIIRGMENLFRIGKKIDPITVGEELRQLNALDSIGGTTTITTKTYGLPHFSDLREYIEIVKTHSLARKLIAMAQQMQSDLFEGEISVDKIMSDFITTIIAMQEQNQSLRTQNLNQIIGDVLNIFNEWQDDNTKQSSIRTGIPELDSKLRLRGVAKSEVTLFAARPSFGKTALLLQIATHIIRCCTPVLFLSLEMLEKRLVMRMLPPLTGIANKAINPTTLKNSPETAAELRRALETLKDFPMFFDRSSDLRKAIATAEFFIQTKGVEVICFDYLTLFQLGGYGFNNSRDEMVGRIADELKNLAIRRDVALIGTAQLNREIDKEFRRPKMSDLRESGKIEQAVDNLFFLWDENARTNQANPELIKDSINIQLYCEKQRDGERYFPIQMTFDKNQQTMESPEMRRNMMKEDGTDEYKQLPEWIKERVRKSQGDNDIRFK